MESATLQQLCTELAKRPGHEAVRARLERILTEGLHARPEDIFHEHPSNLLEVRGRMDALLGRTVFEFKRDLRKEEADARAQLARYLQEREATTGARYTGLATDGASYQVYALDRAGALREIGHYTLLAASPEEDCRAWLAWLDSATVLEAQLLPEPYRVQRDLGGAGVVFRRAQAELEACWGELQHDPEAQLKFGLWQSMLRAAYCLDAEAPGLDAGLFIRHTYLTLMVKAIAHVLLLPEKPAIAARSLLDGAAFLSAGIHGALESDFFDWSLLHSTGETLILQITKAAGRFDWNKVQADVLKGLYESLIDAEQRHDLGEYYTPDWLAARICAEVVQDPLTERVLDPACGSGAFVFHAVRQLLAAAEQAGLSRGEALARACRQVIGLDLHPVAVLLARTSFLLALKDHLPERSGPIAIPVYLGDALQWNVDTLIGHESVHISTPDGQEELKFPAPVLHDEQIFSVVLAEMTQFSSLDAPGHAFNARLERWNFEPAVREELLETYSTLAKLYREGRDHIWAYVARNQGRPVWLRADKVDCIVGNPPWVAYRYMAPNLQERFKQECRRLDLWVGGNQATQQDLCAYFYVRAVELYLRSKGRIGMVLPFAALSREAYRGFRKRRYGVSANGNRLVEIRVTAAWSMNPKVEQLFPVPACVLFAQRTATAPLPAEVRAFQGTLPYRNASLEQARQVLTERQQPWPASGEEAYSSPYAQQFYNGATFIPRRFWLVARDPVGQLGVDPQNPPVQGRAGRLDKAPWNTVPPWGGRMPLKFLHPVLLGENITPFRVLGILEAVIPWDEASQTLLDAQAALNKALLELSSWLRQAEEHWERLKPNGYTLIGWLNYMRKLTRQFPAPPIRVVFTKSGTYPAAAILTQEKVLVDNTLYWGACATLGEARYLSAVLNSETTRLALQAHQSQGQWGARDIHKHIFRLPIPRYAADDPLHQRLAGLARQAEQAAALVAGPQNMKFQALRRRVRGALQEAGLAQEMDAAVARLLER